MYEIIAIWTNHPENYLRLFGEEALYMGALAERLKIVGLLKAHREAFQKTEEEEARKGLSPSPRYGKLSFLNKKYVHIKYFSHSGRWYEVSQALQYHTGEEGNRSSAEFCISFRNDSSLKESFLKEAEDSGDKIRFF